MKSLFLWPRGRVLIPAGLMAAVLLGVSAFVGAAASERPRAWIDQANGYAIGGYDPVDYFVHKNAVRPEIGVEAFWGGVSWKFSNAGNRSAFLAHPRTYAPRFGGADPYLLAKRREVLGNPVLFDIYKDRLYLFYSGITLSRWKAHRAAYVVHAKQAWPKAASRLGLNSTEPANPVDDIALDDAGLCEPARWLQVRSNAKKQKQEAVRQLTSAR